MTREQYEAINNILESPEYNALLLKIQDDEAELNNLESHNLGYIRGIVDIFTILEIPFQLRLDGSFYVMPKAVNG